MTVCAVVKMGHVSASVTVGLPLSLERNTLVLTVGLPLSLERNTLVLTVAVILTTATTPTTLM